MSFPLMKLVFENERHLTGNEDHVLLYIANKVNEEKGNVAWCSHAYLSRKTRLSLATVARACKSLRKKGLISWVHKKAYKSQKKTNHYTINFNLLKAMVEHTEVSERHTHITYTDTQVDITVSDNNLINNLSNNLNIINQKPRHKPRVKPSNNPPTTTTTLTNKLNKLSYTSSFLKFWENIPNKVSKGIAENNYFKLDKEWIKKPEELSKMYNAYYNSIDDKQFAKQPAFWLSAKKYLDKKPKKKDTDLADPYVNRLHMFKEAVEAKNGTSFIKGYAQRHPSDVERAIGEGQFTKDQAIEYLDFRG